MTRSPKGKGPRELDRLVADTWRMYHAMLAAVSAVEYAQAPADVMAAVDAWYQRATDAVMRVEAIREASQPAERTKRPTGRKP